MLTFIRVSTFYIVLNYIIIVKSENTRPIAILPWSQYISRLSEERNEPLYSNPQQYQQQQQQQQQQLLPRHSSIKKQRPTVTAAINLDKNDLTISKDKKVIRPQRRGPPLYVNAKSYQTALMDGSTDQMSKYIQDSGQKEFKMYGIPTHNAAAVQPTNQPTNQMLSPPSLENLFQKDISMEEISKIIRTLLRMENNQEGGQSSILEKIMSSFHRDMKPFIESSSRISSAIKKPQSLMEQLLNTNIADQALKKNENLIFDKVAHDETKAAQKPKNIDILSRLPPDQQNLLKDAIISGEISPDSELLKGLISNNSTDLANIDNRNRLTEWLRENRSKLSLKQHNLSEKVPYYGKYLGSFSDSTEPSIATRGALWAVDDKRFIISKFVFHPKSQLNDNNITFWLGPQNITGNVINDLNPSENGFSIQPVKLDITVFTKEKLPDINATSWKKSAPFNNIDRNNNTKDLLITAVPSSDPSTDNTTETDDSVLLWYDGFQPILIELPDDKLIKQINWVAIRNHKQSETIASIILPNGPLLTIPSIVKLRPLSSNGFMSNISSGTIKIMDIKTIVIEQFNMDVEDELVWFMVGKDLLPNRNGHIVPLWNESSHSFSCSSLKAYKNETITLRLPNKIDLNEVVWFSVFSLEKNISYAHVYIPYNSMFVPDLSSVEIPNCIYNG